MHPTLPSGVKEGSQVLPALQAWGFPFLSLPLPLPYFLAAARRLVEAPLGSGRNKPQPSLHPWLPLCVCSWVGGLSSQLQ